MAWEKFYWIRLGKKHKTFCFRKEKFITEMKIIVEWMESRKISID